MAYLKNFLFVLMYVSFLLSIPKIVAEQLSTLAENPPKEEDAELRVNAWRNSPLVRRRDFPSDEELRNHLCTYTRDSPHSRPKLVCRGFVGIVKSNIFNLLNIVFPPFTSPRVLQLLASEKKVQENKIVSEEFVSTERPARLSNDKSLTTQIPGKKGELTSLVVTVVKQPQCPHRNVGFRTSFGLCCVEESSCLDHPEPSLKDDFQVSGSDGQTAEEIGSTDQQPDGEDQYLVEEIDVTPNPQVQHVVTPKELTIEPKRVHEIMPKLALPPAPEQKKSKEVHDLRRVNPDNFYLSFPELVYQNYLYLKYVCLDIVDYFQTFALEMFWDMFDMVIGYFESTFMWGIFFRAHRIVAVCILKPLRFALTFLIKVLDDFIWL